MTALVQGSQEWLDLRKKKIGSSDAAVLMKVSPWSTPFQLWCEKLSLVPEKTKNAAMQRGLDLERKARHEFEKLLGIVVFPQVFISDQYDFMMASLDGIDIEQKRAVEIKCPGKVDHQSAMDGVVPEKYIPQLQHQMIVANLDMIYYFSYTDASCKVILVERDLKYAEALIEEETKFWDNLQNFEAPDLIDRDYIERKDLEWMQIAQKWLQANGELKKWQDEEEKLKKALLDISGQVNAKGGGVKLMRIMRKGNVDYQAIPSLQDVNLESYRKKPVETWRLTRA